MIAITTIVLPAPAYRKIPLPLDLRDQMGVTDERALLARAISHRPHDRLGTRIDHHHNHPAAASHKPILQTATSARIRNPPDIDPDLAAGANPTMRLRSR